MKNYFLIIFSLIFLTACGEDGDGPDAIAPTNLMLTTMVGENGEVSFAATADNANYFNYYFGETSGETATYSADGKASHTYSKSGSFTVTVRAHTSQSVYTSETANVTVEVEIEVPTDGYSTPESYEGMTLVWRDEFDGNSLNEDDWTFEIGNNGGWGNNELEYYQKENTTVEDGHLIIEARKESKGGFDYTSSRIKTQDKQVFKYGRIDIRAALPKGQGIWPALWMLGNNITEVSWPKCGEIDIMEMVGGSVDNRDATVHSTLHWDSNGHAFTGDSYELSSGLFADEFHVFTLIWNENTITSYVDDQQFFIIDIKPADLNEFHEEFFLLFNVAVGGDWPGSPDASTVFPQRMVVDYVRVFQEN
ncbi:family 16 glycosylhydrolase [Fulvivirga ligni]|uniref:family 16 glycosylhydrolase n=1 Tax=Fulvivirga ligni TaxID=2904246 RepID=UPI001F395D06|nr:family 16 glycosylhydrolase [Fulvivirga ligni]UII23862.1 family 16 glycosylhydrolase [Fulvivirga ligni]